VAGSFWLQSAHSDFATCSTIRSVTGGAIQGSAVGTPTDSEDTLRFTELSGVRPMIETYPLERAQEAFARMMSGDARQSQLLRRGESITGQILDTKFCWH
jgi:D-arabinose 1-dehydrogenase-like Zn-dependent alcohol dehydrogenase